MNELLKKRGFKIKAVREASGIPDTTFYRWVDNPTIRELIAVSDFTNIPIDDLIQCYRPAPGTIDPDPSGGDEN